MTQKFFNPNELIACREGASPEDMRNIARWFTDYCAVPVEEREGAYDVPTSRHLTLNPRRIWVAFEDLEPLNVVPEQSGTLIFVEKGCEWKEMTPEVREKCALTVLYYKDGTPRFDGVPPIVTEDLLHYHGQTRDTKTPTDEKPPFDYEKADLSCWEGAPSPARKAAGKIISRAVFSFLGLVILIGIVASFLGYVPILE